MQETTIKRNKGNYIKNKTLWFALQPILDKHSKCWKKIQRTLVISSKSTPVINFYVQEMFSIKYISSDNNITPDVLHLCSPWSIFLRGQWQ